MATAATRFERKLNTYEEAEAKAWAGAGYPSAASPRFADGLLIGFKINEPCGLIGILLSFDTAPDAFGDSVRAAQERPEAPDPTYKPDDFTGPGFDADAAYRRAMGGGA